MENALFNFTYFTEKKTDTRLRSTMTSAGFTLQWREQVHEPFCECLFSISNGFFISILHFKSWGFGGIKYFLFVFKPISPIYVYMGLPTTPVSIL